MNRLAKVDDVFRVDDRINGLGRPHQITEVVHNEVMRFDQVAGVGLVAGYRTPQVVRTIRLAAGERPPIYK